MIAYDTSDKKSFEDVSATYLQVLRMERKEGERREEGVRGRVGHA